MYKPGTIGCTYDLRQTDGLLPSAAATMRIVMSTLRLASRVEPAGPTLARIIGVCNVPPQVRKSLAV